MLLELVKYRKWWYAFSAILIIPGTISLILYGLNLGIDFTGGTLLEVKVPTATQTQQVREVVGTQFGEPTIQSTGQETYQIRVKEISPEQQNELVSTLTNRFGTNVERLRVETVGPVIGADITRRAFLSVALGSLLIVLYIAYSFRNVPKPASGWRFGTTTILTLLHDILFTLGVFSLLGHYAGVVIDANFVAAILTVLGFSVHDTIVVFDRIRENLVRGQGNTFEDTVNFSIVQTMVRSINTSFTVILVLSAMYFFGGESIQHFVLALLVGIAIGTYSSIFNAAPILVTWQNWSDRRLGKRS